ncbi:MAG: phospho-sugar mutase, partial [Bacteroidales bacterium]|nr:phospho-sugar mutase [Bacteroidales bacterium]
MKSTVEQRIQTWLDEDYDQAFKDEIRKLQKENPQELEESFYRTLEFGTGGLRGIMGVGTNR